MHTINEIYSHFSLQLGHTMIKVVPIAYDINASEVAHTHTTCCWNNLIQCHPDAVTGTIDRQHTQQTSPFKHTQPWEYIDSAATYRMLLKWHSQRTCPFRLAWYNTSRMHHRHDDTPACTDSSCSRGSISIVQPPRECFWSDIHSRRWTTAW